MGLHQIPNLVSDHIRQGDSDGVFRAGDSQDVLVVDVLDLNAFCFGSLGSYLPINNSFLSHSGEGESNEKKDGNYKFVGFHCENK